MQLDHLLAMAQMPFGGHNTIEQVATAHPTAHPWVLAELRKTEAIQTAATFAGLLVFSRHQNCRQIAFALKR